MVIEADQEERTDAGQFPKEEQQQHVVGQYHAEHRGHEYADEAEKAISLFIVAQINRSVQKHRCADERHQHNEGKAQPVEHEAQIESERRHPAPALAHRDTGRDLRIPEHEYGEQRQWKSRPEPDEPGLQQTIEIWSGCRNGKTGEDQGKQRQAPHKLSKALSQAFDVDHSSHVFC
jgi:hypothetical protein